MAKYKIGDYVSVFDDAGKPVVCTNYPMCECVIDEIVSVHEDFDNGNKTKCIKCGEINYYAVGKGYKWNNKEIVKLLYGHT